VQAQIEEAEKALYRLSDSARYGEGPIDFAESLRRAVVQAERAQARGGRISGIACGFTELDSLLGGLQPSDLIIVAGRPGMGKSSLATNMAFHAARNYLQDMEAGEEVARGAPVLLFSLEMAAQQLAARILSEQTEIEMWKIRNGRFSESEWEKFVLTMQELSTLPLYIDDTGGISIAQIAARARRLKREKQVGVVIIDYLQLIEPTRRTESRVQEITEVTKGLKALAKELNVPVVALSQLSRAVEARQSKEPQLSDLRESGALEQDADVIVFLYRPERYGIQSEDGDRVADIIVGKQRNGPTGKVQVTFIPEFASFERLARREPQPF